jgi:rhodanese-related sulfurtransferase
MNINLRQVLIIILGAFILSFIRYFLLNDYDLLKKSKLDQINISYEKKNLYDLINSINTPTLVDIKTSKLFYDNNLVTFLDARDSDSFNENHIKGALNLPYDNINDIVNFYDLSYSLEIGNDFSQKIEMDDNSLFFGLKNGNIFISDVNIPDDSTTKYNVFLIYCSGDGCSLSEDLGFYLFEELGIKKIFIYEGGMPEWLENNYPIE